MSTSSESEPIESRPLAVVAIVALLTYGVAFAYLCVDHVRYPGFVEPMEGSALHHIERFATGKAPYPMPQGDFIGLSYMPLYYVVCVPFHRLFGDSFVGPRLVSVIGAILSGMIVTWIAWRETRSRTGAVLAAALYVASYRIMDAWLTCALPDSLLMVWILLGYCFWAYGTRRIHDVAWLVCFTLAFWTKQHGALFFGCAVLYALLFRRNALPKWNLVAGLSIGGPLAYLSLGPLFGDGFFHMTLAVPGGWDRSVWLSVRRTAFVLIEFVPIAGLLTTLYWCRTVQPRPLVVPPLAWFSFTTLVAIAVTMMAAGSSNNHYIPFLAIACVTTSISLLRIASEGPPRWTTAALALALALAIAMTVIAVHRFGGDHPIPEFVPIMLAIVLVAVGAALWLPLENAQRAPIVAVALVLGQLGCDFFWLPDFVSGPTATASFTDLRAELVRLDGEVIWYPYGYVPQATTGVRIAATPSAIAYEDIERRNADPAEILRDVEPFRRRLTQFAAPLHVLSHEPLDDVPGLPRMPDHWELIEDYGDRFAGVRQLTTHWYGGGQYPRFLYRKRTAALTSETSAESSHVGQ